MLNRVLSVGSAAASALDPEMLLSCLRSGWVLVNNRGGHGAYKRRFLVLNEAELKVLPSEELDRPELVLRVSAIIDVRASTMPTAPVGSFDVETDDALLSVEAGDEGEAWMQAFSTLVKPVARPARSASDGGGEWVPNSSYSRCRRCKVKFTLVQRRHHCRSCGHLFCGSCAKKSYLKVVPGSARPGRHCVDCFVGGGDEGAAGAGGEELRAENRSLKKKIARMESASTLDLSSPPPDLQDIQSPLSMITQQLASLAHDPAFCEREPRAAADISHVVTVLRTSEDIYKLDARVLAHADEETRLWLVERFDLHRVGSRRSVSAPPMAERAHSRTDSATMASAVSTMRAARRASLQGPQSPLSTPQFDPLMAAVHAASSAVPAPPPLFAEQEVTDELLRQGEAAFDVLAFSEATNGSPLRVAFVWCLEQHGLLDSLPLVRERVDAFACRLNDVYRDNPYHNAAHGADVLLSTHHRLLRAPLAGRVPSVEILAMLLASAGHDADHPGLSNNYLATTKAKLAVRYNDRNVLENHHAATLFRLLLADNFAENVPGGSWTTMRTLAINAIIGTDLKLHFEHLSRFQGRLEGDDGEGGIDLQMESDRHLVLITLLKLADLGHSFKPTLMHLRWSERITEEFYVMGDAERKRGLPISPFCDRTLLQLRKSQLGFLDFLVRPLVHAWCEFVGDQAEVVQVDRNREWWNAYKDGDPLFEEDEDTPDASPAQSPAVSPRTSITKATLRASAIRRSSAASSSEDLSSS